MKMPDLVKWILSALVALIAVGGAALGESVRADVSANTYKLDKLQEHRVSQAAVDARLQTRLDNIAKDVDRILKLLEREHRHD